MPRKEPNRVHTQKEPSHKPDTRTPNPSVSRRALNSTNPRAHVWELRQPGELPDKPYETGTDKQERLIHASRRFVALSQMKLARTRQEAITTVKDILANFIGTEQFACIIFRDHRRRLECLFSMGVNDRQIADLELASGATEALLDSATRTGATVVPLRLQDEPFGFIVIFTLLPQKNGMERGDFELCDLLSQHAAACLSRHRFATEQVTQ